MTVQSLPPKKKEYEVTIIVANEWTYIAVDDTNLTPKGSSFCFVLAHKADKSY